MREQNLHFLLKKAPAPLDIVSALWLNTTYAGEDLHPI
jgi:hypothetical protein